MNKKKGSGLIYYQVEGFGVVQESMHECQATAKAHAKTLRKAGAKDVRVCRYERGGDYFEVIEG